MEACLPAQRCEEFFRFDAMLTAGVVNRVKTGDRAADAVHAEIHKNAN